MAEHLASDYTRVTDAASVPHGGYTVQVSVVGTGAKAKDSIVGYPIVASHRFGNSLRAEILAFTVAEEAQATK